VQVKRTALILAFGMTCHGICAAAGLESWRRFDVQIDALAEPVYVNGHPLQIHRAVGSGVGLLVEALRRQWIQESGVDHLREDTRGGWSIISRLLDGSLQSLQWRGTGQDSELIWSSNNLQARTRRSPGVVLRLPRDCIAGRTVHGNTGAGPYLQRTTRCARSPGAILSSISSHARGQGYAVRSGDGMLLASGKGMEVVVVAGTTGASILPSGSALVYLQVQNPEAAP
jgi:hypothetical protein